jgi:hypothetical protein
VAPNETTPTLLVPWSQLRSKYRLLLPRPKVTIRLFPPPHPRTPWDTKPLWLPAFPGASSASHSGKGDIMKPLINGRKGMKAGAKNYHASSKVLKRCQGLDVTTTCSNSHPFVESGPQDQMKAFITPLFSWFKISKLSFR